MAPKPRSHSTRGRSSLRERRQLMRGLAVFAAVFTGAELLHYWMRSEIAPLLVGKLTVAPAGYLIARLSPGQTVHVLGNTITTAGMRFLIAQGCEGLESMLLVAAALLAMPLRAAPKLLGIIAGTLVLWATNQVRIIGLFFVQLHRPAWFDTAHILVGQTLVILVGVAFFVTFANAFMRRTDAPAP